MREILRDYFDGRLSRRRFFHRLVATGLTAAAARALVEAAAVGDGAAQGLDGRTDPASYTYTGTGGELLMEQIRAAGSTFIFHNPGSMEAPFFDALTDRPDLHPIMGLHEGIVIAMADGYAKVTQRPAVVNVHAAVGTAAAAGQLYNAHLHGTPLVVTAGMGDTTVYTDDAALAPRPGSTQAEILKPLTKLAWEVRQGASNAVAFRRACKLAATSPGGPVYVAYSSDGLSEHVSGQVWPGRMFMLNPRPRPAPDKVEALARMLIEARRPTVVFGDEIWKSGAQAAAVALVELLGLAAATSRQAFSNFPTAHALYTGSFDRRHSYPDGSGADLIVQFGAADPGGRLIPDEPLVPSGGAFVAVGLDTNNLGRTEPFDLAIVADVGETLNALLDAARSMATAERLQRVRAERQAAIEPVVAERRDAIWRGAHGHYANDPIHPDRLDYEIARAADPHAIVVEENFTGRQHHQRYGYRADEKMLLTKGGSLGWGVGAAIGAKIGAPDREVILNIGDGAVMYSSSGFWTMGRYEVPVLTVVWNNRNYQMVRNAYFRYNRRMVAAGRFYGTYLGNPDIDFVGLAGAQGVGGERIASPGELPEALARGLQAVREGRPYLLDVLIARVGGGGDSTWHHAYSVAARERQHGTEV